MANVSVTNDDGIIIDTFIDQNEEIGNLDKPMARSNLIAEIADAVRLARKDDKRDEQGAPIVK
jgi:hypothetical protein